MVLKRFQTDIWLARLLACLVLVAPVPVSSIVITPIDLNEFFSDPSVAIEADGSSAVLEEDPFLSLVLLSNDPFFGDPNVVVPGSNVWLVFDYIFSEPNGNDDEFGAFLIDVATGFSVGPSFEIFVDSTTFGTVEWDLSSLTGNTLGLQFQLSSGFGDTKIDSLVSVSNVTLEGRISVPAPATLFLVLTGFWSLGAWRASAC